MHKYVVGIDNGISGAFAVLNTEGELLKLWEMPIQKTRKGNEVDIVAVRESFDTAGLTPENAMCVIEEPGGSQSAKAASSMAGSFHALRAFLALGGYRYHRITPQSWQKPMLKCKPKDTKPAALVLAKALWPKCTWLASERCRVPNDGFVDAALICEYARRIKL